MARGARARAGASRCSCTDAAAGRAAGARRRARRRGARDQRRGRASAPTSSCSATSPPSSSAVAAEVGAARQGRRLDPRRARRSPRSRRPTRTAPVYRVAAHTPVEVRQGVGGPRAPTTTQDALLDAGVRALFARARHARRARRRARRRRDGPDVVRARLRRARRRGAGRRRRAPRPARRPGRRARRPDAAPARPSCCAARGYDTLARAPRGHLAGRLDRARARRAGARRACAPRSATRSTPCWRVSAVIVVLATPAATDRRLRRRADLRLHDPDHRLHRDLAVLQRSAGGCPYSALVDAVLGFLRDVCEPFLRDLPAVHPAARRRSTSARSSRSSSLQIVGGDHRRA